MTNELAPTDAQTKEIRQVITSYWPTATRFHFSLSNGHIFGINHPTVEFVDDKRAITWFKHMFGKTDPSINMATIYQRLRVAERLSFVYGSYGGAGVCGRTMEDEEQNFFPGLQEMLEHEKGKVVFIGNGISPVPLFVAQRYRKEQISEPPVVHDMFSYPAMEYDLWHVIALLHAQKLPVPTLLEQYALQASALCAAEKEGSIRISEYFFSLGNPPDILKDASLVLNLMGPLSSILNEQLSLLCIGGKLVHMTFGFSYRSNKHFRVIDTRIPDNRDANSNMTAEIIERIR